MPEQEVRHLCCRERVDRRLGGDVCGSFLCGVITVDVKLDYLEINQCPGDFSVANAFKNTARCHYKSQYCVPLPIQIPTNRFQTGGYKCECRQGYEYPFNDLGFFFDGQMMEIEYAKMMAGNPKQVQYIELPHWSILIFKNGTWKE
ncbi:hypothetical protein FSP39_011090 [Pinctada imbricata]|uniref:GPR158/179 extracellular domain-containing protein n=1 Tax=Pinctada imbricata TaxID=66713 RepID=A0AA88Y438_PINIB|nr:hypothetical protein FSP39_011090 [Pinctada imbricata]